MKKLEELKAELKEKENFLKTNGKDYENHKDWETDKEITKAEVFWIEKGISACEELEADLKEGVGNE